MENNQGEEGIGDTTDQSNEGLEMGGASEREGGEEDCVVQEWRIRFRTVHTLNAGG